MVPETEKVKESDVYEDDGVDILTVEKNSAFSDSGMSQELCFLPPIPSPDVPDQQDKCVESSSKLMDSNQSRSPLSDEAGPNRRTANHASSPPNVRPEDAGGARLKRKRKPSEKGLGMQAEKVRKPLKSSGRLSKVKNKSVVDQDNCNGFLGDDVSD